MTGQYEDIINMPHHTSAKHPRMSMIERAAQFSPFAALTGHSAAIRETARQTNQKIELDENSKARLDEKQRFLLDIGNEQPEVSVTYFIPDEKKDGGEYVTVTGKLKKVDEHKRVVVLTDRKEIPMDDIIEIESPLLQGMFQE